MHYYCGGAENIVPLFQGKTERKAGTPDRFLNQTLTTIGQGCRTSPTSDNHGNFNYNRNKVNIC